MSHPSMMNMRGQPAFGNTFANAGALGQAAAAGNMFAQQHRGALGQPAFGQPAAAGMFPGQPAAFGQPARRAFGQPAINRFQPALGTTFAAPPYGVPAYPAVAAAAAACGSCPPPVVAAPACPSVNPCEVPRATVRHVKRTIQVPTQIQVPKTRMVPQCSTRTESRTVFDTVEYTVTEMVPVKVCKSRQVPRLESYEVPTMIQVPQQYFETQTICVPKQCCVQELCQPIQTVCEDCNDQAVYQLATAAARQPAIGRPY